MKGELGRQMKENGQRHAYLGMGQEEKGQEEVRGEMNATVHGGSGGG